MIINVDKINAIIPHLEMRRPFSLDIDIDLEQAKLQSLFYKIWAEVGDDALNEWLESEDYKLTKNISIARSIK